MRRTIVHFFITIVFSTFCYGSLPWTEDFNLANGTTVDNGSTAWSVDISGINGTATFAVSNGEFKASNTGGEGIWFSEIIDISGTTVEFSVDIRQEGSMETNQDYIRVSYKLDGGSEQVVSEIWGNFSDQTVGAGNLTGGLTKK